MSTVAAAALPTVLAMGVEGPVARALAQLARVAAVARVAGLGVGTLVQGVDARHYRRHYLAQRHWVVRFRPAQ